MSLRAVHQVLGITIKRSYAAGGANTYDLKGTRAVVTGGAQGIGLAISQRLVASGAAVSVWDSDECALTAAKTLLPTARFVSVDVTNAQAVEHASQEGADILVTSAGITGPNGPSWEYSLEDWQRVINIDLTGVFLCNKYLLPGMISRGYGRIVNVASIAGKEGNPNAGAYSAAKAGVIALTKSIAKETADKGDIAVNCITPAAAKTRIFDQMKPEHIDYMLKKIPRGRFLTVEEAASMVAWLVSKENSFTTGAAFDLSGGRATY